MVYLTKTRIRRLKRLKEENLHLMLGVNFVVTRYVVLIWKVMRRRVYL